ncbi:branched-chain amino acid ABC transporter permease [Falsiroseomonas oryzae]|uniref:branched-chain amino acid ABC transporter permease n=1 Tax=Falsiroseomonas oryzae TaxID=2766473 RepID=UPI0022EA5A43|nr:branched-chain amino acid ABC transporter permease [Roseomonas sp. MO-31]
MDLALQLLLQGVGSGAIYAVVGLSFGLIFNTTRVFHFAHGAILTLGGYTILLGVQELGAPLPLAMLGAAGVAAIAGMACEILLYRPLRRRGAPPLLWFLASFALLVILQNILLLIFGGVPLSLSSGAMGRVALGPLNVSELVLWKVAAGIAATLTIAWVLVGTRLGKELRAVVSNPEMARIAGIDLDRRYLHAYALGSALTVPVGAIALFDQGVSPDLGETQLLIATVAVFAGGIGSYLGGALGGLVLGLVGAVAVYVTNASFQTTLALAAMTAFLLLRPNGLLGIGLRRA